MNDGIAPATKAALRRSQRKSKAPLGKYETPAVDVQKLTASQESHLRVTGTQRATDIEMRLYSPPRFLK